MLKQLAPIVALGGAAESLWLASWAIGPLRDHPALFLGLMVAEFLLCLWAFFRFRLSDGPRVWTLLGFALLFRLTLVPAPPYQSEDVYRYLWDARVAAAGISPYRHPPDAPELAGLRDARVYPQINSKPYVTAYPPVSQLLFRASTTLFGESVAAMKLLFSALEFAALLLAWRLAAAWGRPLEPLVLWAWNPLFVFEFSHSGHSDGGMLCFALLALWLLERGRASGAAAAYGLAVLSKLHPALWFPLLLRRLRPGAALVAVGVVCGLGAAYFVRAPLGGYLRSLRLYYRLFEFNAGLHYLAVWIGRQAFGQVWDKRVGPYLIVALAAVAATIWLRFPIRENRDLVHAFFWLMTADLALSTTVHPWYLSWAAFALPFYPYAFMTYWTGSALLSYVAYGYQPVHEPPWVLCLEYLPTFGLMAWEIARGAPLLARSRSPEAA